jgi:uncharacterized protein YprB with RNaseH-like and TPR domain
MAASPFPPALGILAPDFSRYAALGPAGYTPGPGDLLFFDLETTGLSGGAGTVAFLAAFGRLTDAGSPGAMPAARPREKGGGPLTLRVDQYLLLDYPGEDDFLQALLPEFGGGPLVVTYNGKSFDSQILKTRCLMNGLAPPLYAQADLLHPARRLWKRVLPSCSQGELEAALLGIARTGDTPGALAPDIWFSFLKTGETGALLGICDHNLRDIYGLARLFGALAEIAGSPCRAGEKYRCDLEELALLWRQWLRRNRDSGFLPAAAETGAALLELALSRSYPRALYASALDLLREGRYEAGRRRLLDLVDRGGPAGLLAAAYRRLAVDAEWRLGDREAALVCTEAALALDIREGLRKDLDRRRERLLKHFKA